MNDRRTEGGAPGACERVRARLELLVDGALPPLEAARDAGHLEACAGCAAERAAAEHTRAALGRALGAPVDAAWRDAGLAARLAAADAPREAWSARLLGPPGDRSGAPVLAAAAAVLVLLGLGASGALDDVSAGLRAGLDVPVDGKLKDLVDDAVSLDRWLGGWLPTGSEGTR